MAAPSRQSATDMWTVEYGKQGIPSSFRAEPSGTIVEAMAFLDTKEHSVGNAVDIGCGTGRNSIYLAERGYAVYSMDLVPTLIWELRRKAGELGLDHKIHAFQQSIDTTWPLADASCQLAMDTFCFKHLISLSSRNAYRDELVRVTAPGSHYIVSFAGRDDGYYGQFPNLSSDVSVRLIVDPANGIQSMLYDREELESFFSEHFTVLKSWHKSKQGLMHGAEYLRSTHVLVMERKPFEMTAF